MSEFDNKYPKFVTPKWVAKNLAVDDKIAIAIGAKMDKVEEGWEGIKDTTGFAESFLEAHMADPDVAADCRQASGKKTTLFSVPADPDLPKVPADPTAKTAHKFFAESARAAAERGEHKEAIERGMLEMLEYGGNAQGAFALARDTQQSKNYTDFVETAREIEVRAIGLGLVDKGLNPTEALGEAKASVNRDYAVGRLVALAEQVEEAPASETVKELQHLAAGLAEAARCTTAHMQISTAPLATQSAIAYLRESVGLLEAQQEVSEDAELSKQAMKAFEAANACKDHLVDRDAACEGRIKAHEVVEAARAASKQVEAAAAMPVKNMSDMKKVQKVFLEANKKALEACKLAASCAKYMSGLKEVKQNDKEADALFSSIEEAFQGARERSTEDVKARAEAAKLEQDMAVMASEERAAAVDKEEQEETDATDGVDKESARKALLDSISDFAAKRWDTNLATQTLRRITDRRKEVIGQLWEAVENEEKNSLLLAEKFVEQFQNSMDARRRLDAVVRLMGRGESMDPRTAKWFIDKILKIAKAAKSYHSAYN